MVRSVVMQPGAMLCYPPGMRASGPCERVLTMWLAFACAASILASRQAARAQDNPRARLSFSAPAEVSGCPTELALQRAVAARLGYWPFDDSQARTVIATISRNGV